MSLKSKIQALEKAVSATALINQKLPIEVIDKLMMAKLKKYGETIRESIQQEREMKADDNG